MRSCSTRFRHNTFRGISTVSQTRFREKSSGPLTVQSVYIDARRRQGAAQGHEPRRIMLKIKED